jgi:oligosaccharide repeat unit polymerase
LLAHWILFVRRRSVWVLMLAISPVLLTHFASGTRFYLLFSVVSPLVMIYAGRRVGILVVARTVVVGLGLAIVAGIARTLRGFGYTGTSTIELDTLQVALAQSEGVVLINAQLIDYFQRFDHLGGRSLASMLLFWIPRQVWPDKPTLIGFWFPRAYGIKVESGFSAAAGFCGDAYADFGFTGGLLVCGLAGIALAMTEARVASWLIRREESAALGAIFFGGAFFGMRSPDTTFIMLMGATFWWFTYLGAFRLARVRGPVIDY